MSKSKILLLGLITLVVFPIPAIVAAYFFEDKNLIEFLSFDTFKSTPLLIGAGIGIAYAFLGILIMRFPIFDKIPLRMDDVVRNMRLGFFEILFLSICAGVGEELLFRNGIQTYLGPFLTSILFVVVHGYLDPRSWKKSLYGFVVLPLSFLLGYGMEYFGIWYAISLHFSYDLVLFLHYSKEESMHVDA